jgi:hypothetical protein
MTDHTPANSVSSISLGALVRRVLGGAIAIGGCVGLVSILSALLSKGSSPSVNTVLVVGLSLPYGIYMFGSYALRGRLPFSAKASPAEPSDTAP